MLITQLGGWTADMWGAIIGLFNFIPNWGWMIIVFTVCLKLLLSPLDFWQRKLARDNARKQAAIQPELQKIQKKYGNDKQLLNQKTMELYRRENVGLGGSCIGMLVNMGLTLFIFMTLFYALMGMSTAQVGKQFDDLKTTYDQEFAIAFNIENTTTAITNKENDLWQEVLSELGITEDTMTNEQYTQALEKFAEKEVSVPSETIITIGDIQKLVLQKYETEVQDGWLWVKNIWRPDTNTASFATFDTYAKSINLYSSENYKNELNSRYAQRAEALSKTVADLTEEEKTAVEKAYKKELQNSYNFTTYQVQETYDSWNGYYILVVLAAAITFLSVTISQMQSSKKKGKDPNADMLQATTKSMNIMKFILPIFMIIFALSYSALFALYIVTNSVMSTILSFLFLKYFEKKEKGKKITITTKNRPDYSR